jgi:uncharacterized protein (DUF885 family)
MVPTVPARADADADAGNSYDSVLFHASGLSQGSHNLTLRNVVQGQRLSFDRLLSTSNL